MDKTMNAEKVLANVNACIEELVEANKKASWTLEYKRYHRRGWGDKVTTSLKINAVYDELSIFDWWPETLSVSNLKQMKAFLETAIKLGYKGYVCFKVGASGCANGMWAHKNESTDGYSPEGEFLYRSFTPEYTAWDARLADGSMVYDKCDDEKTRYRLPLSFVKKFIA